jgi:phosphoesterase RecJ-like protein
VQTATDTALRTTIQKIERALTTADSVLVVSHIDPDGDAIGTQLAFGRYLKQLGRKVALVRDSVIPDKYRFLPDIDQILPLAKVKDAAIFDTVLVLECPHADRSGGAVKYLEAASTIINIDHHPGNVLEAAIDWVDTGRSSVGEMAYDYFEAVGFAIDAEMATQLFTAILTDTGRFRFESTTPHALVVAAALVRAGADPRQISDRVYFDQEPELLALLSLVLATAEFHGDGRICLLTLTRKMLQETGANLANTEGLVDYSLYARGVQVGALLREIDKDNTKISLRSRNGRWVDAVANGLNGGGHPNAAGCRMNLPHKEAALELVRLLEGRQ